MAPGRPVKTIKITVPRHNAQRLGTKLEGEIKSLIRSKRIRAEIYQPSPEIAQAAESASEWNSLLITARADRGPQWDVGTQQFLVDNESDLYYDPTALWEAVKKQTEAENAEEQQQQPPQQLPPNIPLPHQNHSRHHTPRIDREYMQSPHHPIGPPGHDPSIHHRPHYAPPVNYSYPSTPQRMNMNMGMGGPSPMSRPFSAGQPGNSFNSPMAGQFLGNETPSPMRMNSMGGMGMMDPGRSMGGSPLAGIPGMGMGSGNAAMGAGGMGGGGMAGMGVGMGGMGAGIGGSGMVGGMGNTGMGGGGMGGAGIVGPMGGAGMGGGMGGNMGGGMGGVGTGGGMGGMGGMGSGGMGGRMVGGMQSMPMNMVPAGGLDGRFPMN